MMNLLTFILSLSLLAWTSQAGFSRYNLNGNSCSSSSEDLSHVKSSHDFLKNVSEVWAVLVAGSNGYDNYRHQADICHAYHLLQNHGVRSDHIITMMYDDIAKNTFNPYPGEIFNTPSMHDVYEGVRIDYRGKDVTPSNFIAVLTGNKSNTVGGNGRILESHDHKVFIYFSDHGGTGILSFPDDYLTIKQFSSAIKQMYTNRMFMELVIYVEACESGSMFNFKLPPKVYAVTAANDHESSWSIYCDVEIDLPCLGDEFSINWMEDSEEENLNRESIENQFIAVKNMTHRSHVCRFGDHTIWREHVAEFQGNATDAVRSMPKSSSPSHEGTWSSRDVSILRRIRKRDAEKDLDKRKQLTIEIHIMQKKRLFLDKKIVGVVKSIVNDVNNRKRILETHPTQLYRYIDCHDTVVRAFHESCFNLNKNPYALKYIYVLANLCETGIAVEHLVEKIVTYCASFGFANIQDIV